MTIEFRCHECQHKLRTSDDKAGLTAACPSCGTTLTVPSPDDEQPDFDSFGDFDDDRESFSQKDSRSKECPMCGALVSYSETTCSDCGENFSKPSTRQGRPRNTGSHRGGLILGLAIIGPFCCCIVTIVALVFGHQDLTAMDEGRMDSEGYGLTLAGVIIAWASLGLPILAAVIQLIMVMIFS
ncbi:hypothetical protein MNBD_PLANCTO02-901 [hydrothermal vent metagenome]|uniref:DUF4190 domain-containing protein n=1 Tax=hydrothermal vent metagenome TaxID=652676 RepID=A0A3B1DJR3_9ZZZZ